MKRTLWLLLLLPAVLAAIWASQVGRPEPNQLFLTDYTLSLKAPITAAQLLPIPASLAAEQGPLTPLDILAANGVGFPVSDLRIYNLDRSTRAFAMRASVEMDPQLVLGQRIQITLKNTAVNHHRFYQYLQSTLAPLTPNYIAAERTSLHEGAQIATHIRGRTFGITEYLSHGFVDSEHAKTVSHTLIQYGSSSSIALAPPMSINGSYQSWEFHWVKGHLTIVYPGPAWHLILLLFSLPAIFLYVLRHPLSRMLRLPLARKNPQPVKLPASSGT